MKIQCISGDIVDVASIYCDCAAVWLRSGFNRRFSTWAFNFASKCRQVEPVDVMVRSDRPWLAECDSLWELCPPLGRLRFVYVFGNSNDICAYPDLSSVRQAVNRCLHKMVMMGLKNVAMIHIPASENGASPNSIDDVMSAKKMIESIVEYGHNFNVDMNIFLVDINNDFQKI